ncbi:MAG: hypothetical protein A2Z12_03015 [Actinobacteria bacterium RBG_16_68_21]|nr:MAG: hypothetical protein A2Z12_03015 [Actinobacteria bacterium RBG_16_68_21]
MRLEIMRRSDIALRAVRLLHREAATLRAAEIAARLESTAQFIPQVLTPLVKAGWIASEPGPRGGYRLTIEPSRRSILELVELIEGPTDNGVCVLRAGPCASDARCSLHDAWSAGRDALLRRLADEPVSPVPKKRSRKMTASSVKERNR